MKDPEISIIVPVYNIAPYIGDCIESILNQSFSNFELILIDDGSSDETLTICHDYKKRDPRILIFENNHQGVGAARNLGLCNATGNYIAFIDGDDLIHPNYLEILYNNILFFDADIVNLDFEKVKADFKIDSLPELLSYKPEKLTINEIYHNLFDGIGCAAVWGALYNKKVLDNQKFDTFSIAEDIEFNSRVFQNVKNYIYIPLPLYYYRIRRNSAVTSGFSHTQLEGVRAVEKSYDNIIRTKPEYTHYALIRLYKSILSLYYNSPAEYKEKVFSLNEGLKNRTIKDLFKNKKINPLLKLVFISFLKFPWMYTSFRQFMEWKSRH